MIPVVLISNGWSGMMPVVLISNGWSGDDTSGIVAMCTGRLEGLALA